MISFRQKRSDQEAEGYVARLTHLFCVIIFAIKENFLRSVRNTLVYVFIFGIRNNCPISVRNTLVYVLILE